jgi:hypothetical protein
VSDTWELIANPFYDYGGNDVGMGWQLLASLERVAYGYTLAVIVGVALGVLVGQSTWAMRGLDPLFQVLRTVPPLAWLPLSLAAFQDSNPSAIFVIFITAIWPIIINTSVGIRNIPQDYRNVARVLRSTASSTSRRSCCRGGAVHLHRLAHRDRPGVACDRRGRDADRRRRHRLLHLGCLELVDASATSSSPWSTSASSASPRPHRRRHRQRVTRGTQAS